MHETPKLASPQLPMLLCYWNICEVGCFSLCHASKLWKVLYWERTLSEEPRAYVLSCSLPIVTFCWRLVLFGKVVLLRWPAEFCQPYIKLTQSICNMKQLLWIKLCGTSDLSETGFTQETSCSGSFSFCPFNLVLIWILYRDLRLCWLSFQVNSENWRSSRDIILFLAIDWARGNCQMFIVWVMLCRNLQLHYISSCLYVANQAKRTNWKIERMLNNQGNKS